RVASRYVMAENLIRFETASGLVTYATTNHRCLVSLNRCEKYATYLMRQGDRWRVGTVQLFGKPQKGSEWRFSMRCHGEKADAGWILSVHDSDMDARIHENIVSANYGITQ